MIYLVKAKGYNDFKRSSVSDDIIEMLLSKGAKLEFPYSKVSSFKGTSDEWDELKKENTDTTYQVFSFGDGILVSEKEYVSIFDKVEVVSVLQQDAVIHDVKIDLDLLSDQIMNKVINNAQHLFNQKLEVHQPNMPLFQYNEYRNEDDMCTQSLQNLIDEGWRVVCICPQPDQRRPDYILGKYTEGK